jgi:hypothetical protein
MRLTLTFEAVTLSLPSLVAALPGSVFSKILIKTHSGSCQPIKPLLIPGQRPHWLYDICYQSFNLNGRTSGYGRINMNAPVVTHILQRMIACTFLPRCSAHRRYEYEHALCGGAILIRAMLHLKSKLSLR